MTLTANNGHTGCSAVCGKIESSFLRRHTTTLTAVDDGVMNPNEGSYQRFDLLFLLCIRSLGIPAASALLPFGSSARGEKAGSGVVRGAEELYGLHIF